jgi:hypothetical protein
MKTSNKFLIAAVAIIIISQVMHDFSLKAAYLKANYKSRFYHKEKLNLADFDAIDVKPSEFTSLSIEQGPKFAVWVNEGTKSDLSFKKNGRTLQIVVNEKTDGNYTKDIIIICPDLKSVIAREKVKVNNLMFIGSIEISGFKQDTMYLQSAKGITINLMHNRINKLTAGTDTTGGIISLPFNWIKQSVFNIRKRGTLQLYDKKGVGQATYNISPSANVTLAGDALDLFPHQKVSF